MADGEHVDEVGDSADIFYVCKKMLEELKEKLKSGAEIAEEAVNKLTFPDELGDEEIMVPVDMRGVGEAYSDVDEMVEKLGPKGTAEAFVKAAAYFVENKDNEPEDERPQEMTAAEWRKVLEQQDDNFAEGEEEDFFEGEEEEIGEEVEEEDADKEGGEGGEDADDAEPAAKKAKTD